MKLRSYGLLYNSLTIPRSQDGQTVGLPEAATSSIDGSDASRDRSIYSVELLISHTLDECLHPRALRLGVGQLPVEIRMCVSVDAVFGLSVWLPFVGIVESSRR